MSLRAVCAHVVEDMTEESTDLDMQLVVARLKDLELNQPGTAIRGFDHGRNTSRYECYTAQRCLCTCMHESVPCVHVRACTLCGTVWAGRWGKREGAGYVSYFEANL